MQKKITIKDLCWTDGKKLNTKMLAFNNQLLEQSYKNG